MTDLKQTFDEWIAATDVIRAQLREYGKTGKPADSDLRSLDALKAIEMTDTAARLLSEAERHLSHQRELAMWAARKENPELTSREREIVEKSKVRDAQLMVASCEITHKSCLSRYFQHKG